MRKTVCKIAIVLMYCGTSFAETKKNTDEEVPLIHEIINEQIEKIFGTSNLTTRGNVDVGTVLGHESNKTIDPYISVLGDAFITYKNNKHKVGYGAEIGLKIKSGVMKNGGAIVDTANIHISNDYLGILKLGYTESAAYLFNSASRNILAGYKSFECSSKGLERFYGLPKDAISNGAPGYDNKAAKVVWLSPTYKGFSAGLSYAPNNRFQNPLKVHHIKEDIEVSPKTNFNTTTDYYRNLMTAALSYEYGLPDSFHYRLVGEYWHGNAASGAKNRNIHDLNAYNIGLDIGYGKFNTSFNYTDNGKSGLAREFAKDEDFVFDPSKDYSINDDAIGIRPGADAGKVYRVAIGYSFGKLKTSFGYLKSKIKFSDKDSIKHDVLTVATEYTLNRAIGVYAEYDYMGTKMGDRARAYEKCVYGTDHQNDHANIFILGLKINL